MGIAMNDDLVLYGGTYLNKGGAAIAYGTLKVLRQLGLKFTYIIDPEPHFPFAELGLKPIYRFSDTFSVNPIPSISPIYTAKPFMRCLTRSMSQDIKQFKGLPIWHIGDSPFSDARSALSVIGQIVALHSLKVSLRSRAIVGGVSLSRPNTKIAKIIMPPYFKNHVDYIYTRGEYTNEVLNSFGVAEENRSSICDFAFHLDKAIDYTISQEQHDKIKHSGVENKPKIALVLRDFGIGDAKQRYLQQLHILIGVLEKEGFELYYIPTTYAFLLPENDYNYLTEKLQVSPEKILLIQDNTPEQIISIMNQFDVVISTRLHGAVLGTLAHVPTIHLYEGHKSIEVLGEVFGDLVPSINLASFTEGRETTKILSYTKKALNNKSEISSNLELNIQKARRRTLCHLRETFELVLSRI